MTPRILSVLTACISLTLFSCYVMPDPAPGQGQGPQQTITTPEQQRLDEQREEMKKEAAREKARRRSEAAGTDSNPPSDSTDTLPKPTTDKPGPYPTAQAVPGKDGFVFSPYNSKVIDVRDIPSGTLVADPTFAPEEKKRFRVP